MENLTIEEEKKLLQQEWNKLNEAKELFEQEKKAWLQELEESGVEFKLFVGNLSPTTTEPELRSYFEPYGTIKEAVLLRDRDGQSKRSGFVKYLSKKSAEQAIAVLDGKVSDKGSSEALAVRFAKDRQTNLASSALLLNQPLAAAAASPFATNVANYTRAMAFGLDPTVAAASANSAALHQHALASAAANSSMGSLTGSTGAFRRGPNGANIYINNLNPYATEAQIRAQFQEFGSVLSVKLFNQHGYGFVSFENPHAASTAITCLHGFVGPLCNGKPLEVSIKKDKETSGSGSGSGSSSNRFSPY